MAEYFCAPTHQDDEEGGAESELDESESETEVSAEGEKQSQEEEKDDAKAAESHKFDSSPVMASLIAQPTTPSTEEVSVLSKTVAIQFAGFNSSQTTV